MELLAASLILVGLTLIPVLELRASIPVGILFSQQTIPFFGGVAGFGLNPLYVFLLCTVTNIILGLILYVLVDVVVRFIARHWAWFGTFYEKQLLQAQRRVHRHVERWGWIGLALFLAVPLPGSGVYTGSLAAIALGMDGKRYGWATILGVTTAGFIVTTISLLAL